jgi:hypothetical protein
VKLAFQRERSKESSSGKASKYPTTMLRVFESALVVRLDTDSQRNSLVATFKQKKTRKSRNRTKYLLNVLLVDAMIRQTLSG